jgi:hypothetical protein
MIFQPTPWQVAGAIVSVLGPALFATICASGYEPSNRVLGVVLGLIGVTVGQNWMALVQLLQSEKTQ